MLSCRKFIFFCLLCQSSSLLVKKKEKQQIQKKINPTFTEVEIGLSDINFRGLAIHNSSVWIGGSAGFVVEAAKEYEMRDVAVFEEAEIVIFGSGPKER